MNEWKKVKLGDCVEEVNERTTENNQYEVLTSSKGGIYSQEEYFDKQVASKDNTGYKIIKRGQFTYRSMSDNGTFTINRLENKDIGIVSPAYPVFEAINIKAEYLNYFFQSEGFRKAIYNLSQGSTRTALKYRDLSNIEILLPPIEEQEKIVKILKTIDSIIEKYENLLEEKNKFIKSQFVEMFGDIQKNNRKWKETKFCDLCKNLDNMRKPVSSAVRTSGKYPYYGASGIVDYVNDYIFDERLLLVSEDGANLTARVTPIAFSIEGKNWVNNHAHVLRFEDYNIQKYVEFYFSMIDLTRYITGTAQPKLNQAKLNSIKVPLPDYELTKIFLKINNQIDKQKILLEKQKQNYKKLKKGLMQKLLTGKVRVKI